MPRNSAFTLVELLAATALSTLLFLAALSVIHTLGPATRVEKEESHAWTLAARQQLEWDLNNAAILKQDEHGLILGGYGALDPQSMTAVHLPVLVTYALRDIENQRWLVREQTSLNPLAKVLNFSELVCRDVKSFSVTGSYAPRTIPIDPQTPPARRSDTNYFSDHRRRAANARTGCAFASTRRMNQNPIVNTVIYIH